VLPIQDLNLTVLSPDYFSVCMYCVCSCLRLCVLVCFLLLLLCLYVSSSSSPNCSLVCLYFVGLYLCVVCVCVCLYFPLFTCFLCVYVLVPMCVCVSVFFLLYPPSSEFCPLPHSLPIVPTRTCYVHLSHLPSLLSTSNLPLLSSPYRCIVAPEDLVLLSSSRLTSLSLIPFHFDLRT
jgi:hypothetical protein